jgi:glycogen synthase
MMMEILAEEFAAAGHEVRVVTLTANGEKCDSNYDVVRLPGLRSYVKLLRWSDVCLYASVSLRGLWPIILARRPFVFSHHIMYNPKGYLNLLVDFKRLITRFSHNIACSRSVQSRIPGPCVVVPNAYQGEIFRTYEDVVRDRDIVFVGRLVPEKGVKDLLDALSRLGRVDEMRPQLSIVGDGPEYRRLVKQVSDLGLDRQVSFTGIKRGAELARFVGRHRILAIPSRVAEAFGIVALEGIACGCVVVGTNRGGVPEAIGPAGVTVPSSDPAAMAQSLKLLLQDDNLAARYRSYAPSHLARHSRAAVARGYLDVLGAVT